MIEKEYKVILNVNQYDKLLEKISFTKFINQTNYYFDTCNFELAKLGYTVRIRKYNDGRLILQVKKKLKEKEEGVTVKREFETSVYSVPETIAVSEIELIIGERLNLETHYIKKLGHMVTSRGVAYLDNCELALDKNYYLGFTDYELEIEFENNESEALRLIQKYGLNNISFDCGKYRRFLRRIKNE